MTDPASLPPPAPELDPALAARIEDVIRRGEAAWDALHDATNERFHDLVLSDHRAAIPWLVDLHRPGARLVELGSGVGLMAIVADLLGYEAVGIEIEPELVEVARGLAAAAGSRAEFVEGSFVPPEARDDVHLLDADTLTVTEGRDAWEDLALAMDDFDVVSVYPWPDQTAWLVDLVRRHAAPHAVLLTYSGRDGYRVRRMG